MWMRWALVLLCALAAAARGQGADPWTFTYDVVALIDHRREMDGRADLTAFRPPYTYRFSSEDNARAFRDHPDRYAVRMGGACARMGLLAGHGDPGRYAVRDGALYIFASESCRDTFAKHADRLLWTDDPRPEEHNAAEAAGREWLTKAIDAHGGQSLRRAAAYAHLTRAEREYDGAMHVQLDALRLSFASSAVTSEYAWDDSSWVTRCESGRAFMSGPDQPEMELDPVQARALAHAARRTLIGALRAAEDPAAELRDAGAARFGQADARLVEVWLDGLTTTLVIDADTSRVLALRARDHGGKSMFIAPVEHRFSNWRTIEGVLLPASVTTVHDRSEALATTTTYTSIEVTPG